jgi:prepilin-type N-terminal cleavage/methylation domain-containing protein
MTNAEKVATAGVRHSSFVINSSFVIRDSSFRRAFTLIELVLVVGIITVLGALVLSTVGYARKKAAHARAETEIGAMSAASENYKADNGVYPRDCNTDQLVASSSGNPTAYQAASLYLYKQLSGDTNANFQPPAGARTYFTFKPQMLDGTRDSNGNLTSVTYIKDPFGSSYGYSTLYANYLDWQNYTDCVNRGGNCTPPTCAQPSAPGYNPTFDLWSAAGLTTDPPGTPPDTITPQWIKNW